MAEDVLPSPFARSKKLHTLLILGRTSNIPTVWSNCFAGFLLGDESPLFRFIALCFGATALYIGGMFLNDAFDSAFDRQHRKERPIPAGLISEKEVWTWGWSLLAIGFCAVAWMGLFPAFLALLLITSIVLYDAVHKAVAFAPVLMAVCRFFLYLLAGSVSNTGLHGWHICGAFAMAFYIVGLSYIARRESTSGPLKYWPLLCLAVPLVFSWMLNDGEFRIRGLVFSAIVLLWIVNCLRHTFWSAERNIGYTVSKLLAGIILVDALAVTVGSPTEIAVFFLLFCGALVFQRVVPAT